MTSASRKDLLQKVQSAQQILSEAEEMLRSQETSARASEQKESKPVAKPQPQTDTSSKEVSETAVEGKFDGQFVVTNDGKKYQVSPNYATL